MWFVECYVGIMESDRTIIISVFYGGTWCKGDDDRWQFKNYESEVTDVPKNCTYEQLKDEVYGIINVDRERYNLKMKFLYIQSYQPCAPKEIRRDRDVKIFLRQVTEVVPATSLYVEMFPKDAEFYSNEQVNHNNFGTFNSASGSNHFSTSCPSTKLREETFLYAQNVEKGKAKVHESPIRENVFWESPIRDNQVWESPIRETQTPWESQVPETQTQWETQFPETQTRWDTQLPEPETQMPEPQAVHETQLLPS